MTNGEKASISITLSPAQVEDVLRAAAQGRAPSLSTLISDMLHEPLDDVVSADGDSLPREATGAGYLPSHAEDPRLSRSLMRGLAILACFGPDGRERGIVELAADLGMSPSTAHRYALTLVELGLLDRCPSSRKYRLAGTQPGP